MLKIYKKTTMAFLGLLIAQPVISADISEVYIEAEADAIHILGADFGEGPNVVVMDTFENPTKAPGDTISLASSVNGSWSWLNANYTPTYAEIGRTGEKSVVAVSNTGMQQFQKDIGAIQEIFVSYWVLLDGDYFPGDRVSGPRTFSDDSSFKFVWLYDQDVGGRSADVCLPTHVGGGRFYIGGNSSNLVEGIGNQWWSWDNWVRISIWLKANETNPLEPGTVVFETVSKDKGYAIQRHDKPLFTDNGVEPKVYRKINFPGWVRSIEKNTRILYDDIYIATGPNSAARVELGDAASLDKVTRLDVLNIDSWSPSEIKASHPTVSKAELKNMYLYLTDNKGATNQKGVPLFIKPSPIKEVIIQ